MLFKLDAHNIYIGRLSANLLAYFLELVQISWCNRVQMRGSLSRFDITNGHFLFFNEAKATLACVLPESASNGNSIEIPTPRASLSFYPKSWLHSKLKNSDKIPHAPLLQTSFSKVNTFCGKIPSRPIYLWQGLTKKTGSVMPFTSRPPTSTVSRENTPANLRPDGGFDSPFCRTSLQSSPDLIHSCLLVWTNLGVTRKAQAQSRTSAFKFFL